MAGVVTSLSPGALILAPAPNVPGAKPPVPFVRSNPAVADPFAYPVMPPGTRAELAELFGVRESMLAPIAVQLPQNRTKGKLSLPPLA
jgi:hypothetical protein